MVAVIALVLSTLADRFSHVGEYAAVDGLITRTHFAALFSERDVINYIHAHVARLRNESNRNAWYRVKLENRAR